MNTNKRWSIIIGLGLALLPLHNLWLTELLTVGEKVEFFLPAFGTAVWLMGVLLFIVWGREKIDWGDRSVFIPLIVIAVSIGLSGLVNGQSWQNKLAPSGMGLGLFATYLVARKLGASIFYMLIPFTVAASATAVASGILYPGIPTGGLITNYCASAGYMIFGAIANQGRWQWILIAIMLVGIFFVGTLEAVFILGVLGIVILARRDFNQRFIMASGVLMGLIGLWIVLGYLVPLYEGNHNVAALTDVVRGNSPLNYSAMVAITTGRWGIIIDAVKNTSIIGHGYSLSTAGGGIVHNLPLIISHQIGPVAAVAWLFVTAYCLVKTKWKYAWVATVAMCVFDHYIWTQFAPYWWALVGVSTASNIKSDLIYRK